MHCGTLHTTNITLVGIHTDVTADLDERFAYIRKLDILMCSALDDVTVQIWMNALHIIRKLDILMCVPLMGEAVIKFLQAKHSTMLVNPSIHFVYQH